MYSQFGPSLLKHLQNIIGNEVANHYNILERLAVSTVTQEDYIRLTSLLTECYRVGYIACANDYREKMKEFGIEVKIGSK
jgi:hypothetical protein